MMHQLFSLIELLHLYIFRAQNVYMWQMVLVLLLSRLLAGLPTDDLEVKQVPFATYMHFTSW
jgi:hypothetical protein